MDSIQVCDALSILFNLEKPPLKHLEGFIFLPREGGELHNFSLKILAQELERIFPVDQQKLVH